MLTPTKNPKLNPNTAHPPIIITSVQKIVKNLAIIVSVKNNYTITKRAIQVRNYSGCIAPKLDHLD
jgi:hypothetical protein